MSDRKPTSIGEQRSPERFEYELLMVQKSSATPLFRQLEKQLRHAIWNGQIKPDERLPSTRRLAESLGVARNTVIAAYEQLSIEGFIHAEIGSGARVAANFPSQHYPSQPSVKESTKIPRRKATTNNHWLGKVDISASTSEPKPFRAHMPAMDDLSDWQKVVARQLRKPNQPLLQTVDPRGYLPLREAIADYLNISRGINVDYRQIFITAGAQQGVELLSKVLIEPGDRVCFEDPGYTHAALVYAMAGAELGYVPVDRDGLQVSALENKYQSTKMIYTTPSSHFPLGMTLSQQRRKALLDWAQKSGTWVIEDDYNGEYRYVGRPLTSLHAMANGENVIYIGSFSKLLTPGLRLGYMVVPVEIVEPLTQARWLLDRHSSMLDQAALADFINTGAFARHLRKNRKLHRSRQQAMLIAAKKYLTGILVVPPLDAGLHLIGWLEPDVTEEKLIAAAKRADVELSMVSTFSHRKQPQASVILGFASWTAEEIVSGIRTLGKAYQYLWH